MEFTTKMITIDGQTVEVKVYPPSLKRPKEWSVKSKNYLQNGVAPKAGHKSA
jgi:hypothetical protein